MYTNFGQTSESVYVREASETASRIQRFAKRRSAFRPSPFLLAILHTPIASMMDRHGCRWLPKRDLGSWQGQFWGQCVSRSHDGSDLVSDSDPPIDPRVTVKTR